MLLNINNDFFKFITCAIATNWNTNKWQCPLLSHTSGHFIYKVKGNNCHLKYCLSTKVCTHCTSFLLLNVDNHKRVAWQRKRLFVSQAYKLELSAKILLILHIPSLMKSHIVVCLVSNEVPACCTSNYFPIPIVYLRNVESEMKIK